jgi:CRISPR-associated protein Cst2
LARIGYNDILQKYAIDEVERHKRSSLLLESLLHTFIELNGAMRSSQLPHLVTLEGVITTSTGVIPAPLVSPLLESDDDDENNKTYKKQIEGIVSALNGNGEQVVKMDAFNSISEFATLLRSFIDTSSPFMLAVK